MTDNIKAKGDELIGKFIIYAHSEWHEVRGYDREVLYLNATRCAIIAVEEIISLVSINEIKSNDVKRVYNYWNEVLNYLKSKL